MIPRLVSNVILILAPTGAYAIWITIACAVLTSAVAVLIFILSKSVISWLPARVAVSAITLLIPLSAQEVLGNLANFHWYLLWLAPWLLLALPERWRTAWALAVVALLAGLTEIQMALFLPFFLVRWRGKKSWPIFGGLALGVGFQLATALFFPRPLPTEGRPSLGSMVYGYLVNVVFPLFDPSARDIGVVMSVSTGVAVPILLAAIPLAAFLFILVKGSRDQRVLAIGLVIGSGVAFVFAFYVNAIPGLFYSQFAASDWLTSVPLLRYGVAAGMMLIAIVPIAASVLVESGSSVPSPKAKPSKKIFGAVMVIATISALAIASPAAGQVRGQIPSWSQQLDVVQDECASAADEEKNEVAIAPSGWKVDVTCEEASR